MTCVFVRIYPGNIMLSPPSWRDLQGRIEYTSKSKGQCLYDYHSDMQEWTFQRYWQVFAWGPLEVCCFFWTVFWGPYGPHICKMSVIWPQFLTSTPHPTWWSLPGDRWKFFFFFSGPYGPHICKMSVIWPQFLTLTSHPTRINSWLLHQPLWKSDNRLWMTLVSGQINRYIITVCC